MKIAADRHIPFVSEAFSCFGEISFFDGRDVRPEDILDADILLVRSVTSITPETIGASKLKFIASATAGIEHISLPINFGDDSYGSIKNGIGFAYAPGSNANSVAQYVVAAMMNMAKKNSLTLEGCRIGIVGAGNIGTLVNRYAEAMGMNSILNDPPKRRLTGNEIYRPLEEVLQNSDIVTLHVPLERQGSDPTHHLVNSDFLQQMKRGAILINTSRGKVVDDVALKQQRQRLGGLVLDVWDHEPSIDIEICAIADIATPHIAGYSYDGKINGTLMICRAACSFFKQVKQVSVAPVWNPVTLLSESAGAIDVTHSDDPVFEAVAKAYPIMRDDALLRKTMSLKNDNERRTGFDALRAGYPKRMEFSHYQVRCNTRQNGAEEIIKRLGFTAGK